MTEQHYLTKDGAERLRAELEKLKGPIRQDLARRLREAIQMGDLSENADYITTKEEQGFIEGRIQELEHILRNAKIIVENHTGQRDTVEVGTTITIQEADFPPEVYYMVGSKEADPDKGRISNESPIGQALLGKRVGDQVKVKTPAGELQFEILKIE